MVNTTPITKTLEHFGAARNLTLTVTPANKSNEAKQAARLALSCYVNQLLNYGVVTYLDEQYDPLADNSVMVQSDEGRLLKGFSAMKHVQLMASGESKRFKGNPKGFERLVKARALREIRSFDRVGTVYTSERKAAVYADNGNPYDLGFTQTFSAGE